LEVKEAVLNINVGLARTELILLRIGTRAGCCEYGNEHLGSINCREFLNQPRICWVLKAHSVAVFLSSCLELLNSKRIVTYQF
jgi:hypothetical protein